MECGEVASQFVDEITQLHEEYNEIIKKLHEELSALKLQNLKLSNRNVLLEGYIRECYDRTNELKRSFDMNIDVLMEKFPTFLWED